MATGLIYAAIVAMWAAYLVPLALRRYDEASQHSPVSGFSSRIRVLGRPGAASDADAEHDVVTAPPVSSATRGERASTRLAVRRRRRTLIVLLGLTVTVGAAAVLAYVPVWAPAVPAVLVVAWLVACRRQVLGELDEAADLRAADEEHTVVLSGRREDHRPDHRNVMEDVPLLEADLREDTVEVVPLATSEGGSLWDPLPVTLPTYVDKPRVARTVRTIEFGQPGAWTSGHVEGERTEMPEGAGAAADDAAEHRRAVGD